MMVNKTSSFNRSFIILFVIFYSQTGLFSQPDWENPAVIERNKIPGNQAVILKNSLYFVSQ
jgi:hypothetical protein